ncbi:MAG: response regulator [candidate division WOR-3 bacterium]|nr:response regulator [candidate division WOR-3 bacterium]
MKKIKILFVDDDKDFTEATTLILNNAGYEVIIAGDGRTGLQKAMTEKPDLIILDVILPDINGFSVCREIKENPELQNTPVILFTAISAESATYPKNIAIHHKADAYIEKPASPELLLEKVNFLLTTSKPKPKIEAGRPKILLVDDDPDFLEATKQILHANRFDVITAKDGEEGIQKAKIENPDLIFLDVIMPGKDGYTVCYELRKNPQTRPIPIIMLTAIGQQLSKPEYAVDIAIDHLADDFIDKPVDTQTLLKKIEKHLLFR